MAPLASASAQLRNVDQKPHLRTDWHVMSLRQFRCVGQSLPNVGLFDIRKIREQVFDATAGAKLANNHAHGHTHPPYAWLCPPITFGSW